MSWPSAARKGIRDALLANARSSGASSRSSGTDDDAPRWVGQCRRKRSRMRLQICCSPHDTRVRATAAALDAPRGRHHDALMRTTLTLEPDVARLIEEEAHRQRKPVKQIVNEALRRGLAPQAGIRSRKRFRVRPHATTLRPGIDARSLNQLAEELEDEAVVEKLRPRR
jgi:hypothetical protein